MKKEWKYDLLYFYKPIFISFGPFLYQFLFPSSNKGFSDNILPPDYSFYLVIYIVFKFIFKINKDILLLLK